MANGSKHDEFFKHMMKRRDVAQDFFKYHLPIHILAELNLSSLHVEDSSFIDEKLNKHESDILFSVKNKKDENAFIYILLEHQSKSDSLMPFRLLYYIMQVLKNHIRQHKKKALPLPFIYPLVVYNGKDPWTCNRDFFSLFSPMNELMEKLLCDDFPLLDVSHLPESDLKKARISNLMLASLKRCEDLKSLESKAKLLGQLFIHCHIRASDELLKPVLKYIITVESLDDANAEKYWEILIDNFPSEDEEVTMITIEQFLINKGRKEALQKGREEGRQEGRKEERIHTAIRLLKEGLNLTIISKATELSFKELEEIQSKTSA